MSNATKKKERTELIIGLCAICTAIALLYLMVLGIGRFVAQLEFPASAPTTSTTQTLPPSPSPTLIPNPYDARDFGYENGFVTCLSGDYLLGVDVSEYQGNIDWKKVAAQNIRFAMIRIGGRGWGQAGNLFEDDRWIENIRGAQEAGLLVGIYFFSQAISPEEAREEARFVLKMLDGRPLDMPVAFDWEFVPADDARTATVTSAMLNDCAVAFCQEIRTGGYEPMVYFNLDFSRRMLDLPMLQQQGYPFWLAMYSSAMTFPHRVNMWQYTAGATVNGINGVVDMDLYFIYD